MRYQVVFESGGYTHIDFETDNYDQAQEVMHELHNDMYLCGERNFFYYIKDTKMLELEKHKGYAYYKELARENAYYFKKLMDKGDFTQKQIEETKEYFKLVGKKYGLTKEFKEMGIL